jgi:alpha-glucosidase
MPYLYAAFYEASQTGMPVARSLCINYPFDEKVYDNNYQYQFLFGSSMMVVPVTSQEKTKKLYLPKGDWYNIYTDETITGAKELTADVPLYQLPVYAKASSIIPLQSIVQSTKEKPSDTLQLHIYNGTEQNSFTYYEDEGDGFGYKNNIYCKRQIIFSPNNKKVTIEKQEGSLVSKFTKLLLVFHGFGENRKTIKINGTEVLLSTTKDAVLLDALSNLSDAYDAGYYAMLKSNLSKSMQQGVVINNDRNELLIEW